MLYELRIYTMNPGKLPDINKRFSEVTLDLFKEHGIKCNDFWQDAEGAEKIYYICEFADEAAMKAAWASFGSDPRWIKAKDESHKDGVIVGAVESYKMNRVPYITPDW